MVIFARFILVIFIIELLVFCAPYILPSEWYFKLYLGNESFERIEAFYDGHSPSMPDKNTGWKITPDFIQGHWVVDQWGSRSHKPVSFAKTPGVPRVLFLGNSLMNGGNLVSTEETISYGFDQAATEDGKMIEVMNFATMAYNTGQSYIQLKEKLLEFKPDHIILGLPEAAHAGLGNLFLPFYLTDERNMPYVKPGFFKENNELKIEPPPHEFAKGEITEFLKILEQKDAYYHEFYRYQHFNLSPILWSFNYLAYKATNFYNYLVFQDKEYDLLNKILSELEKVSAQEGFKISYVYIPTPRAFGKSIVWRHLPDYYAQRLEVMSNPNDYNPNGLPIIDLREILEKTSVSLENIYGEDMYHFSAQGNSLIGQGLYNVLKDDILSVSTVEGQPEAFESQLVDPNTLNNEQQEY